MRGGIFGWSYPPGCSGPPEDEQVCRFCWTDADNCKCPECPECGTPACLEHLSDVALGEAFNQAESRYEYLKEEFDKRQAIPVECPACHSMLQRDLRDTTHGLYCETCERNEQKATEEYWNSLEVPEKKETE